MGERECGGGGGGGGWGGGGGKKGVMMSTRSKVWAKWIGGGEVIGGRIEDGVGCRGFWAGKWGWVVVGVVNMGGFDPIPTSGFHWNCPHGKQT